MSLSRTLFCYALACLPILSWFLVCKHIKDYGVLLIAEILVVHILVPILVRAVSDKFFNFKQDRYYEASLKQAEGEAGLVTLLYIIGILILSFVNSSKSWNYSEKNMMFPRWKNNVLIIIYAIFVALIALFVYPASEQYFYVGFAYINMGLTGNYQFNSLMIALITGIKWFFLFDATVKHRNAAVFWTILWVILYAVIDYNNSERWYYSGIALRQWVMFLYIVTLVLYALGVKCKRPAAVSKTRTDNRLTKMC